MARMMIGKDLAPPLHASATGGGAPRLIVDGLTQRADDPFGTDLDGVRLEVRSGEIFGIAGISGNGQQELMAAISGERVLARRDAVRIGATAAGRMGAGRRRALGLGFVPEERLGRGAVPELSLSENALLTAHRAGLQRGGWVRFGRVRAFAQRCIDTFDVKCSGPLAAAKSLSGGNLQKFIVGREILLAPEVLIVAQPTWGLDVGAAAFIRRSLVEMRDAGAAILVISEELDELFEVCDRIAVLANGRLSPARRTAETTVEEIGVWMSGLWPGADRVAALPERGEGVAHPA
jgi:simple sugar transport system ATP-binding protein